MDFFVGAIKDLRDDVREDNNRLRIDCNEKIGLLSGRVSSLEKSDKATHGELVRTKEIAERTAKEAGEKAASVRSGIISFVIGLVMLAISVAINVKVSG